MTVKKSDNDQQTINHGQVFDAASLVQAFFEASFAMVKNYGGLVRWDSSGRAQAAATLAAACATVYAAQLQERQRRSCKNRRDSRKESA